MKDLNTGVTKVNAKKPNTIVGIPAKIYNIGLRVLSLVHGHLHIHLNNMLHQAQLELQSSRNNCHF